LSPLYLPQAGKILTFEALYNTYKTQVYNLALHYVQNREDAQEIMQDVFIAVHKSLETFEERSKLSTWIYRITINKSLDHIKALKRKKRFAFLSSLFSVGNHELPALSEFDHPGVMMEQKEALQHIFSLINELPPNQKTVLILGKIEHKSQQEIAEIMNLSSKAVESLTQRAKTNLEKKLNHNEGK
jgi:RNA polymerase sigma factor (sigma-70 family)